MPDYRPGLAFVALLLAGILVLGFNHCSHAFALDEDEDVVPAPLIPQLEPGKLLTVGGQRGRWWPLETALKLAEEHEAYYHLQALNADNEAMVIVLTDRIIEKDARILRLQEIERTSDERAKVATGAILTAETRRREAEDSARRARAWWRHPALWFGVGCAMGALSVVVVTAVAR